MAINKSKTDKIIKCSILLILSILVSILLEKLLLNKLYTNYSIDRMMILTLFFMFFGIHFIFKLKDLYSFIYNKRYIISLAVLVFVMIFKYSGSSISIYNSFVQPDFNYDNVVLGKDRMIRSDEWAVNTTLIFSQNTLDNKFNYFNNHIRGSNTDMFTIINAPVLDIVSLGKPFNLGYMLFGNEIGLSFWWYGRLIALLLISFELCMIISNKNKLVSMCGMLLITFSSATVWWYSNFLVDILIWGQLAIVLLDKFMTTKNNYAKYASLAGLIMCALSYVFAFYPPWQISFGYVFLALFIWIVLKNRKEYKINIKDVILIIAAIIVIGLIGYRYYSLSKETLKAILNTDYPGQRLELGGNAITNIFSYVYNFLIPYKNIGNSCENAQMLSFFPLPMIMAIIYMLKEKKYKFVLPLLIVSLLLFRWVSLNTNVIFAKATLLFMSQPSRAVLALGLTQIYFIVYILDNINYKIINIKKDFLIIISFLFATLSLIIANIRLEGNLYLGYLMGFGVGFILFSIAYLILNLHDEENKKKLIYILIFLSILNGIFVNPIIKGTDAIYQKPVAKEIRTIVSQDDSLWIVDNMQFPLSNYLIANGAKVLNCTNYYPNFDFWNKIFDNKEQFNENKFKFNRYAHIEINIVKDDTSLEIIQADALKLNLNYDKIKKINIKYILSSRDLSIFNDNNIKFEKIYSEDGSNIFKVIY